MLQGWHNECKRGHTAHINIRGEKAGLERVLDCGRGKADAGYVQIGKCNVEEAVEGVCDVGDEFHERISGPHVGMSGPLIFWSQKLYGKLNHKMSRAYGS